MNDTLETKLVTLSRSRETVCHLCGSPNPIGMKICQICQAEIFAVLQVCEPKEQYAACPVCGALVPNVEPTSSGTIICDTCFSDLTEVQQQKKDQTPTSIPLSLSTQIHPVGPTPPMMALGTRTVLTSLVVGAAFTGTYLSLLSRVGYTYELHILSVIAFSILGIVITLTLFKSDVQGTFKISTTLALLTLVIAAQELMLNSVLATHGLILSLVGVTVTPILAVRITENDGPARIALETIAIVFATRIVLTPFPPELLNTTMFLPVIYTLILAATILYMTYRKIPAREARLSSGKYGVVVGAGAGLGLGAVVGFVEYFILKPTPIFIQAPLIETLGYIFIVLAVMVGVAEELLFRGLLQTSLESVMPGWQAIGLTSVMFGLMHVGWMNPLEVLLAYGAGVAFGYLTTTTNSLMGAITAHGFGNAVLYLIALHPL